MTRNTKLVILGDFNIHLEHSSDPITLWFLDLISCLGFCQHARETVHLKCETLDLVITSEDALVQDLCVHPQAMSLSSHSLIEFFLPLLHSLPIPSIRKILGWKSLHYQSFRAAVCRSKLASDFSSLDVYLYITRPTMTELVDDLLRSYLCE